MGSNNNTTDFSIFTDNGCLVLDINHKITTLIKGCGTVKRCKDSN